MFLTEFNRHQTSTVINPPINPIPVQTVNLFDTENLQQSCHMSQCKTLFNSHAKNEQKGEISRNMQGEFTDLRTN